MWREDPTPLGAHRFKTRAVAHQSRLRDLEAGCPSARNAAAERTCPRKADPSWCLPLGGLLLLEVPRVPARPVGIRAPGLLLVLTVRTLGAH
jgi:hypothetical protein